MNRHECPRMQNDPHATHSVWGSGEYYAFVSPGQQTFRMSF